MSLGDLYSPEAINLVANNFAEVVKGFDVNGFTNQAVHNAKGLPFKQKTSAIASTLREYLPPEDQLALQAISDSLGPKLKRTENNGLQVFFYMPHSDLLSTFAVTPDTALFDRAVEVNLELTSRFTAEFSIRHFLEARFDRCLGILSNSIEDSDPHIRRLISEGTRPRLPWAKQLMQVRREPRMTLFILERLKLDPCRYVTRSVANHLADIGKDDLTLLLDICKSWVDHAESHRLKDRESRELLWIVRHALRYPSKKGSKDAMDIRIRAR